MRALLRGCFALVAVLLLVGMGTSGQAQPDDLSVEGVALTVEDLDRAVPFYRDALSFAPVDTTTWTGPNVGRLVGVFGARMQVVAMRLGDETIRLMEFRSPQGRPIPPDSRSNDLWFQHIAIVVSDMNRAYERVRGYDVTHISPRPQTLPESIPAAAGISAFYFQDPTGNALELIHYPPDKGRDRWHRETEALFLGVDHTAIATADTEASLAFYRDQLGFEVPGSSVNFGPEQERLTGVFGARVKITALRPPGGGIGVELLDYQAPGTGRPLPADTKANDLWHWHVRARTASLNATTQQLLDAGRSFVSPGVVERAPPGADAGAMVRGPSGHALLLMSPNGQP